MVEWKPVPVGNTRVGEPGCVGKNPVRKPPADEAPVGSTLGGKTPDGKTPVGKSPVGKTPGGNDLVGGEADGRRVKPVLGEIEPVLMAWLLDEPDLGSKSVLLRETELAAQVDDVIVLGCVSPCS